MPLLTPHEALIHLMVITSASDRDMTDVELARIGDVVRSWPVFVDFNQDRLVAVAQACQKAFVLRSSSAFRGEANTVARAGPKALIDVVVWLMVWLAPAEGTFVGIRTPQRACQFLRTAVRWGRRRGR